MDWFRRHSRTVDLPLDVELVADTDLPPEAVEHRQAREELRAAIRHLTADQQRVILLRFGEGLRVADVARIMDKSEGAVKILQHRAVKRLRKLLHEQEKS
jgi:RNA polymerase sigma-70 factor (ECF subfamily)